MKEGQSGGNIRPIQKQSTKTFSKRPYLLLLVVLFIFVLVEAVPRFYIDATFRLSKKTNDADIEEILESIKVISSSKHSLNTGNIEGVQDYIFDYVTKFSVIRNSNTTNAPRRMVVEYKNSKTNSPVFLRQSNLKDAKDSARRLIYFESSNIVARINSVNNSSKVLLFSAHYDSNPLSYGANDDGINIAIMLKMIKVIVEHKLDLGFNLVFNFNNGEEIGLLGGEAFVANNKLEAEDVLFVNLEAAGAKGRMLLFQVSDLYKKEILDLYNKLPYPHASVISGDLFRLRIINSMTDFKTYTDKGSYHGLDMAIYSNRAFYHTQNDSPEKVSPVSIKQILSNSLAIIENYDRFVHEVKSEGTPVLSSATTQNYYIYYDVLGIFFVYYGKKVSITVDILILLASISIIAHKMKVKGYKIKKLLVKFITLGFGLFSLSIPNLIINIFNPYIIHGYPRVFFFMNTVMVACYCFWAESRVRKIELNETITLEISLLWSLLAAADLYLLTKDIGVLYFVSYGLTSNLLVLFSSSLNSSNLKATALLLSFISCAVLADIINLLINGFTQLMSTGTNIKIIYILSVAMCSTLGTAIYTMMSAFYALTYNSKKKEANYRPYSEAVPVLSSFLVLLGLCIFMEPFNKNSPLVFHFHQSYKTNENYSKVEIKGVNQMNKFNKLIMNSLSQPADEPFSYSKPYYYKNYIAPRPKIMKNESLISIKRNGTSLILNSFYDTKICEIYLEKEENNIIVNQNAYKIEIERPEARFHSVVLFRTNKDKDWIINLFNNRITKTKCYYDQIQRNGIDYSNKILYSEIMKFPDHFQLTMSGSYGLFTIEDE